MAMQQINVPDGKTLFPYFVKTEDVQATLDDWATLEPVQADKDGEILRMSTATG